MAQHNRGPRFWVIWSCGVVALAVLVWLGLRFGSAYAECTGSGCDGAALRVALFMNPAGTSLDEADNTFVKVLIKPPDEKKDDVPDWLKEPAASSKPDAGRRDWGLKGPPDNLDPHLAKRLAEDAARSAGVLGLLKSSPGSHIRSIFGEDGGDVDDLEDLRGKPSPVPGVRTDQFQLSGSLSREVVGRILRRHVREAKYCHQVALQRDPRLTQGVVVVQFTIAATGQVVAARVLGATLRERKLHRCLTSAVRRWLFPKPRGGGGGVVSCPFELSTLAARR